MTPPDVLMRSERVVLSPVTDGDAEAFLAVLRDPAVRRYLLDDEVVSIEWVRHAIDRGGAAPGHVASRHSGSRA